MGIWTIDKMPTRRTPFFLEYGSKVATPFKIRISSHRVTHFNEGGKDSQLEESLNLLEKYMKQAKA